MFYTPQVCFTLSDYHGLNTEFNTEDSHGWLAGHNKDVSPEPNYRYIPLTDSSRQPVSTFFFSGDLGMFSSFVTHMKAEAQVDTI